MCEELDLNPGDSLALERKLVQGEAVWIVCTKKPKWAWLGAARGYATKKSHRLADIKQSIAKGFVKDHR